MDELILKQATQSDISTLCSIGIETFVDTYAAHNTPEQIDEHIKRVFTHTNIASEFDQPDFACFIAWLADQPVGFIQMRNVEHPPELANKRHIELERIYVRKAYKRMGIGRKLFEHCANTSRDKGFEVLWLGVWEHNPKAIAFYTEIGCTPFGSHTFMLGSEAQHDILLQLLL